MTTSALYYERPKVGGDILTWCTRCKMDLAHVVIAMAGAQPVRVQCKTCRSEHSYRKPKGITAPRAATPRKVTPKVTIRAAEIWEQKLAGRHQEEVRTYSPKDTYTVNQLIQHPTFGLGVVEQVRTAQKVSILFKLGERLLIHGLK
jgi:hypothetical protein